MPSCVLGESVILKAPPLEYDFYRTAPAAPWIIGCWTTQLGSIRPQAKPTQASRARFTRARDRRSGKPRPEIRWTVHSNRLWKRLVPEILETHLASSRRK